MHSRPTYQSALGRFDLGNFVEAFNELDNLPPEKQPEPPQVIAPVPLGTNRLKVGARLYSPYRTNEFVKLLDISTAYDFPTRTLGPP